MPRSKTRRVAPTRRTARRRPRAAAPKTSSGWTGRASSPLLDRYPPKPGTAVPAPAPAPASPTPSAPAPSGTPASPATPTPAGLIRLDRAFDLDGFSQMLGENAIRVEVPREDLAEVLRRITDFMGFGIYVYSLRVHPAPEESLRRFVVELQRVDYSTERRDWRPFEDKGTSSSPFGPADEGRPST